MSMTLKEVVDTVRNHLLTQMEKSAVEDETSVNGVKCLYRGPDGLKCAVGALIKDEFYYPELENLLCDHFNVYKALEKSGVYGSADDETIENVLSVFQGIHDSNTPDQWAKSISALYTKYGIEE